MQSKAIIQQYYEYFNSKNLPSFLNLLDKDVVHEISQGTTEKGIDAFAAFMNRMNKAYDEHLRNIVIMSNEDGSRLAAEFIVEGTYKATDGTLPDAKNQKYTINCGAFFEVKNQKITRISNHYNMNDWLSQVKG